MIRPHALLIAILSAIAANLAAQPATAQDVSARSPLCPYLSESHNPELRTVYYGAYKMRTCFNQVHEGEHDEDGGLLYANPAVVDGLTDPRAANGIHFHAHRAFNAGAIRFYKNIGSITRGGVTFEVWARGTSARAMVWYSKDLQATVSWQFSEPQKNVIAPDFSQTKYVSFKVAWKDSTCIYLLPEHQSRTFGFDGNVVDFIADIRRVTDWAYLEE
ncbi:hypothetical protein [uncultured Celeribacter sp.]|uniref:hypothetical protein n=1 Tax=uncultured Celeribacter sp. TaxID=1303376 RepID=UPI002AA66B2C|nr:hypothetical protein [uncultured Celeribacter sp.]